MIPNFDLDNDLAIGLRDSLADFTNPGAVTNFRRAERGYHNENPENYGK